MWLRSQRTQRVLRTIRWHLPFTVERQYSSGVYELGADADAGPVTGPRTRWKLRRRSRPA
jgi:hypothetical protein